MKPGKYIIEFSNENDAMNSRGKCQPGHQTVVWTTLDSRKPIDPSPILSGADERRPSRPSFRAAFASMPMVYLRSPPCTPASARHHSARLLSKKHVQRYVHVKSEGSSLSFPCGRPCSLVDPLDILASLLPNLGQAARWNLNPINWKLNELWGARSRLYRRRFLQVNTCWKALDEIYKMHMLLHRSDLSISVKLCQTFSHFSANFQKTI